MIFQPILNTPYDLGLVERGEERSSLSLSKAAATRVFIVCAVGEGAGRMQLQPMKCGIDIGPIQWRFIYRTPRDPLPKSRVLALET